MQFKGELTTEVKVIFSDPEKAKAEFIDGDWSSVFWEIEDLGDLAENLITAIHRAHAIFVCEDETDNYHHKKSPEGFGCYFYDQKQRCWIMDNESTGKITVFIGDLEVECLDEVTD